MQSSKNQPVGSRARFSIVGSRRLGLILGLLLGTGLVAACGSSTSSDDSAGEAGASTAGAAGAAIGGASTGGATGSAGALASAGSIGTAGASAGGVTGASGSAGASGLGGGVGVGGSAGASAGGSAGAVTAGGAGAGGTVGGAGGVSGSGGKGGAGAAGSGGTGGSGGAMAVTEPCDLYAAGATPCVAAHSTIRALYGAYNGNLYQVRRASDKTTMNIGVLSAGGFANAAAQDTFCAGTTCTISILYDQSGKANHLTVGPAGGNGKADVESNATALKLKVGGHSVYAVFIAPGNGYRNNKTTSIPTGNGAQGAYMVTSGTHVNAGCCFDYGNAETSNNDTGNGHMEAIYVGKLCWFPPCTGAGPWVMGDLENGLFSGGNGSNAKNTSVPYDYLTAMLKGHSTGYALKGGNAQTGTLTTMYNGVLPTTKGYDPMHLEGSIILGVGGDNSNVSAGTFFEGAMTAGFPPEATEDAVQANIVAAGYGK